MQQTPVQIESKLKNSRTKPVHRRSVPLRSLGRDFAVVAAVELDLFCVCLFFMLFNTFLLASCWMMTGLVGVHRYSSLPLGGG